MGAISEHERAKYADIWQLPQYGDVSPGANFVPYFLDLVSPRAGASILDIGAGAGAASRLLKDKGFDVTAFDLTDAAWRHTDIPLITGTIWDRTALADAYWDCGYCCDMMEHLPERFVGAVVSHILDHCQRAFFSVCFHEDHFGAVVREPLHLTVQPFLWWRDLFSELGSVEDAIDLMGDGVYLVSNA